jgi:hypothetical protein
VLREVLYHHGSAFYTHADHCSRPNSIHNVQRKTGITSYFFLSNCLLGTGGRWSRMRSKESAPASSRYHCSGPERAVPGVPRGILAARSTELGHGGAREAGSSNGGVELGAATASSWAVVASSSVMQGRVQRQDRRVCHSRRRVHLVTHHAPRPGLVDGVARGGRQRRRRRARGCGGKLVDGGGIKFRGGARRSGAEAEI